MTANHIIRVMKYGRNAISFNPWPLLFEVIHSFNYLLGVLPTLMLGVIFITVQAR